MKYYIAGNRGLVGSYYMTYHPNTRGGNTSTTDYTNYLSTYSEIAAEKPTHLIVNAATVGGLQEDLDRSFELLCRNLKIQNNLFEVAAEAGVQRLLLQGSTCSYPEHGSRPFNESQLFEGKPFDGYMTTALPKLVGMYQCQARNKQAGTFWRTAICSNMFGPNDRTGEHAHVVGALMQKFVDALNNDHTEIEIWGTGKQSRDLIYVKDAVDAMDTILNNDIYDVVNVASGIEVTIKELTQTLCKISGFTGRLWFNENRPEGIKNRAIDNTRLKELGWAPKYDLEDALAETYEWYRNL